MSAVTISQPDITLLLDLDGVIRRATLGDGLQAEGLDGWVGLSWADTLTDGTGEKVRRILQDVHNSGVSAYRTLNQRLPSGAEMAVEYSTIRLGDGGLIAIGKNQQTVAELQSRLIAAQQAREQDYWKLREVETRYRLLFDTSSEAVLVIRAEGFKVVEANLAALRTLSLTPGQDLLPQLLPNEHETFRAMLARVRGQGRAPGIVLHLGVDREAWTMRASLIPTDPGQVFLLQLSPMQGPATTESGDGVVSRRNSVRMPIEDLLQRLPDAFVVVDQDGVVQSANPAFLDLIQVATAGSVIGEHLGRWLSRPGADSAVLLATIRRHQVVRLFATTLQGEMSSELEVEISAAGHLDGQSRFVGLLIRDVSRRNAAARPGSVSASPASEPRDATIASEGHALLAALGAMADGLGQTSLPTLVKETVSLVERHHIEAALERADGNRTATAELLGLSRQSLYMKLNRYGLDTESLAAGDHDS